MVFFLGVGGGEEELQDSYYSYVIYYIISSGSFALASSDHREGSPGPQHPGQTRVILIHMWSMLHVISVICLL
jgi:hypothetical protein